MLVGYLSVKVALVQVQHPEGSDQSQLSKDCDLKAQDKTVCLHCPGIKVIHISETDVRNIRRALMALGLDPKLVEGVKAYKLGCDIDHCHSDDYDEDDGGGDWW